MESEPHLGRSCTSWNEEVKDQVCEEVLNDHCITERNSCGSGNKHWISSFHPNWGFANVEDVSKICSQAADRGTEGASERNLQGHAGLHEPWSRICEDHHHWWWDLGLWLWPRNKNKGVKEFFESLSYEISRSIGHDNLFFWKNLKYCFWFLMIHYSTLTDMNHNFN